MKSLLIFLFFTIFLAGNSFTSYSQCATVTSSLITNTPGPSPNCTYMFTPTITTSSSGQQAKLIQFSFTNGGVTQYVCYTSNDGVNIAVSVQSTACGSVNQKIPGGTNVLFPQATIILPCGNNTSSADFIGYLGASSGGGTGPCTGSSNFPTILPVKLIAFTAKNHNGTNILNWQTASETNSDKFVIQRSADTKIFEDIAEIEATGESQSLIDYQYIDTAPLNGTNYYRLKQIDKDNSFTFSKIISVNIEAVLSENKFYTYPNPISNNHLKITGIDTILDYQVYTQDGKMIACQLEGNNNEYSLSFTETPKAGVYILWTKTQKQTQSYRIIIE